MKGLLVLGMCMMNGVYSQGSTTSVSASVGAAQPFDQVNKGCYSNAGTYNGSRANDSEVVYKFPTAGNQATER